MANPTKPNPHHPTSEELYAYRDGELPADRRTLIEAHVLACAQCGERIDELSALEADLRLRPDAVGGEYYERMTESVLAPLVAEHAAAEAVPSGAGAPKRETPRIERRRPDPGPDPDRYNDRDALARGRRAFRLPWIGVAGTAAAAVAVALTVVILVRQQSAWVSAPRPGVLGVPEAQGPGSVADSTAREEARAPKPPSLSKQARRHKGPAGPSVGGAAGENQTSAPTAAVEREGSSFGTAKDEVAQKSAARSVPTQQESDAGTGTGGRALLSAPSASGLAPTAVPPGATYADALRRHGLPLVWDPGVPRDALLGAETELRFIYQSGRADSDSARIRLYLAEAERLRLPDYSNAAAVEEIAHHYRRTISLARSDAALANLARKRLEDLYAAFKAANP